MGHVWIFLALVPAEMYTIDPIYCSDIKKNVRLTLPHCSFTRNVNTLGSERDIHKIHLLHK